jgi:shikimate kinase
MAVGRVLARKLRYGFIDTDAMIEARAGSTIKKLVEREGWPRFREMEREVLRDLRPVEGTVIATGGGVPEDPGNLEILPELGRVVWLTAENGEILKRLTEDGKTMSRRPPLGKGDFRREMETVLERRIPLYRAVADLTVDTTGKKIRAVAGEIAEWIEKERYVREHLWRTL